MILYDYFRSSASYRVRIALHIKGISFEKQAVNLIADNGQHRHPAYLQKNPQGRVPCLAVDHHILTQSLAILEFLEEQYPHPSLLPHNPFERAYVRGLAQIVACDIHPLNNVSVLNQLRMRFDADEEQIQQWYHHWLQQGLEAFEKTVQKHQLAGKTCYGDMVTIADLCLIPQLYNARRFHFDLTPYPTLCQIETYCLSLAAFQAASPEQN